MKHKMMSEQALEQRLQQLARPGLTAGRRQAIWQRAQAKANAQAVRQPVLPVMRLLRPAVAFIFLLTCLWGATEGSAWPGTPLYVLRRETENTFLAFVPVAEQGPWRLELLTRRIHELTRLVETQRSVPPELLREIEASLWTLSTYPDLWGLNAGQVLAYIEHDRQIFLDMALRYPNLREAVHLLTVSSLARDRLWGDFIE